jgi:hypothetical protein
MTTPRFLHALLALPLVLAACAAPTDEDANGASASEDELRSLVRSSDVVGTIPVDGSLREVNELSFEGHAGYHALRFKANAGDRLNADVFVLNASDPAVAILGDDFKTIVRDTVAVPGAGVAKASFTAKKTGAYYVAFRNAQKWGAVYEVRVSHDTASAPAPAPAPVVSFRDGWTAKHYDVTLQSATSSGEYNGTFCPSVPPAGSSLGANNFRCRIDLDASTITCQAAGQILAGSATIANDGSFFIDSAQSLGQAEYTKVHGHLEAGGVVRTTDASFMHCDRNSSNISVFNSISFGEAQGTAVAR